MAKEISTTTVVTIGGVDYSSQLKSVDLGDKFDELSTECFGDLVHRYEAGLGDGDCSFTFRPNTDLTNYTTIRGLGGTIVAITVKPSSDAIAAANPEYQFNVLMQPPPLNFDVGSIVETSVSCKLDSAITTDVTP